MKFMKNNQLDYVGTEERKIKHLKQERDKKRLKNKPLVQPFNPALDDALDAMAGKEEKKK